MRDLLLQFLDGFTSALLFLDVYFFMVYFWQIQFQELFLLRLLVYFFVTFEELVLGKLFRLGRLMVLDEFGCFH